MHSCLQGPFLRPEVRQGVNEADDMLIAPLYQCSLRRPILPRATF